MIHDPTTEEGRKAIKESFKKLRPELEKMQELAQIDVDDDPTGRLTNPSEIQIRRMMKYHEDR